MSTGARPKPRDRPPRAGARVAIAACGLAAIAAGATATAAISPQDRRLSNTRTGLSVEAPAGWTLSQHTGYGETVVLLLHPDGSRISVSATTTPAGDANGLFALNRPGLVAQGLAPSPPRSGPRGSIAVDLNPAGAADRVRQLYLVRAVPGGRQAVILTLVSRVEAFDSHTTALDFVVTRLAMDDPARPPPTSATDGGATKPASTGSGGNAGVRRSSGSQPSAADPKRDTAPPQAQKP